MKPLSASALQNISGFLKHPLLITVIGTVVASAIIPGIVGRSNARAVRAKARIDQAIEVMNASNTVDMHLHKMKTAFEAFEKDALTASPEDYQKRRDELRARIYSIHSDFDSTAWVWAWNISYRARVLTLISEQDFAKLQFLIGKYSNNLVATSHEFDKPWRSYLPADASLPKQSTAAIMPALDKPLRDLQLERDELVRSMAEVFQ
jgi:hypothetical protein